MTPRARGAALLAVLLACLPATPSSDQSAIADGWQSFAGTWTATGRRDVLPAEDGRTAVTVRLSGALVLTRGDGLGRGFRAEFLGFDDGSGSGVGRAVWTDDDGDRVFSRLTGSGTAAGRRVEGTITGGTGRYAGLTGSYAFAWQYVLPGDEGVIQARAVSLAGRYRREPR